MASSSSKNLDKYRDQTYRLDDVPTHPLAAQYQQTVRSARRAFQAGRLHGARPNGLIVFVTGQDIEDWILSSRTDAIAPVPAVEPEPPVSPRNKARAARRRLHNADDTR